MRKDKEEKQLAHISVAIVGGESTGKSTLVQSLAEFFDSTLVPEYARYYLKGREGFCERSDLDLIALGQDKLESDLSANESGFLFTDTDVLTTVVWYELYYEQAPEWMLELATKKMKNFYFVCSPDFPWEKDEMRYAGEHRHWMNNRLVEYLQSLETPFEILTGGREKRLRDAVAILSQRFPRESKESRPNAFG